MYTNKDHYHRPLLLPVLRLALHARVQTVHGGVIL